MNWEDLRADQMAEAVERSKGLCIFPIGCAEKHGVHLPLGTDSLLVKAIAERATELEEAVVFPTGMWLGDMLGSKSAPLEENHGAISLKSETLLTVIQELLDEIGRAGFRKILILNGHGGNSAVLSYIMRCHFEKKRPYAIFKTSPTDSIKSKPDLIYAHLLENRADYPMLGDKEFEVLKHYAELGSWGGGHGDFVETADIFGTRPELVEPKNFEALNGLSLGKAAFLKPLEVDLAGKWVANYPDAFNGYHPVGCNEAIGQAFILYATRRLAKIIRALKEDETCVDIGRRV